MLKIYIVRHGQDEDNANGILNGRRDTPLTDIGVDQAREIAGKVRTSGIRFDSIYTSPLRRAQKTAEIIADSPGMPKPKILPELIERDFGIMTGKQRAQIVEMCLPDIIRTETVTYFLNPEGAETFPRLLKRGEMLLASLTAENKNGNILLVTHGDIGKMIYAAYYGLGWTEVLKQFHFGNSDMLELSRDSLAENAHVHKIKQYDT
jgi:probable phosphoglycerate mutase